MHRIAAATINQTPLDWTNNQARILKLICEAKTANVDFLCFPELCISGYGCEDAFFAADTSQKSLLVLKEIINSCDNIIVLVGLPLPFQGLLYNAVAVIQNQKLLGFNLKKNLPREGVHYESRWFHPWKRNKKTLFKFEGQSIPIGDLTYRFGELGVGIEICEEAWGSRSGLNSDECHVVFCPSASHFALEKYQSRVTLVENASRALSSLYVYTNLVGLEAGRLLYDGGSIME